MEALPIFQLKNCPQFPRSLKINWRWPSLQCSPYAQIPGWMNIGLLQSKTSTLNWYISKWLLPSLVKEIDAYYVPIPLDTQRTFHLQSFLLFNESPNCQAPNHNSPNAYLRLYVASIENTNLPLMGWLKNTPLPLEPFIPSTYTFRD